MTTILLIEDDPSFVQLIENFLRKKGHSVVSKYNLKDGMSEILKTTFGLILLDYHLPDGNAFEFIHFMNSNNIKIPIIIMTGFNDVKTVVKAMRLGVADYITKPVNPDELLMTIDHARGKNFSETSKDKNWNNAIKGESQDSKELNKHIELVAPTNLSLIIQGESGTGKEYVARRIHLTGKGKTSPFVAIDCGALSDELAASELFGHVKGAFTGALNDKKGVFELAEGGTLFMDEIGNLSYPVQVKLLRAVQEREIFPVGSHKSVKINVRLIAATNDDLRLNVKNGGFREDLFHRLNEFSIQVPPLRKREDDLLLFINCFVEQSNGELSKKVERVSNEVMTIFKTYSWPGNLRELKNIIRRAVLLSKDREIKRDDLPEDMLRQATPEKTHSSDLKQMKETNEKELIVKALSESKYNKTKAAGLLNIDRKTLYLKMAKYGIEG